MTEKVASFPYDPLRSNFRSNFRGVYRCGKKWKAQLQFNGTQFYLGTFETEEEAADAYERKASLARGEFSEEELHREVKRRSATSSSLLTESNLHHTQLLWERCCHLNQRLLVAKGVLEQLKVVMSANPDAEQRELFQSLTDEIELITIVKLQIDTAISKSVTRDLVIPKNVLEAHELLVTKNNGNTTNGNGTNNSYSYSNSIGNNNDNANSDSNHPNNIRMPAISAFFPAMEEPEGKKRRYSNDAQSRRYRAKRPKPV